MMNLMHWRLMVAVADAENVTRAAERYGITQSGASQAISQMEDALGIKVFVRDRRTTTVTAAGQQVIGHARRMLAELEAIQHVAHAARTADTQRIRLASFPSVFAQLLPPILQTFERLHPHVEVISLHGTDEEVEHWLDSGSVDVGVVMNPSSERRAVMLGRDRWVLAAPLDQRIAGHVAGATVDLHAIVDQPFIVATGGCHLHGQTLVSQAGLRLSDIRMTVSDWSTAYALIEAGQGMAIVPESTLPKNLARLQILELAQPVYRTFGLVCSQQGGVSIAIRSLLDVVSATLVIADESAVA
ncbi:LysR family transcriptional regulator [Pseudomonas abietaniphila]